MVNKSAVRRSGYIFEYRLSFLGASRTGKTSVLNRFISDTFTHRYRPTVEDHTTHIIDHNGNMCVCLMVDTSGSGDFPAMRRLAITKGNAFLVFYSINERKSFEIAINTINEIKSLKPPTEDVKILLIANKTDLESQRKVEHKEGENFVESINRENVSSLFFECSSKNNKNIDLIFKSLLDLFIPEETVSYVVPERSSFTRMSLRKKARKHRLEKQKTFESLEQQNTNCYSETNLTRKVTEHALRDEPGKLLRASSLASGLGSSDEDSGTECEPSRSPRTHCKEIKRQNTAKTVFKKTFDSVQKLLKTTEHEGTRRASTMDSKKVIYFHKKQTSI